MTGSVPAARTAPRALSLKSCLAQGHSSPDGRRKHGSPMASRIGYNGSGPAADGQKAQEEGAEQQFGLPDLEDLQQGLGGGFLV